MDIPKELKERLRTGRVIPFVGAGVSMAVKSRWTGEPLFPSWMQLLERAADRLTLEGKPDYGDLVRSLLGIPTPDYLEAARRAREGLGAIWSRFLTEEFGHTREEVDDESLRLAERVWELGSRLLITTNCDRVLHWSCPKRDDLSTWNVQATAEQSAALREAVHHPTVWHLHGYIDNANSIILTPDGYRRLYPEGEDSENRYRAALVTLRSFMTSHTLLFVGFSLDDQLFGTQLRGVHDVFEGASGPHYVLVRKPDKERVRTLHLPVEIITFEEYGSPLLHAVDELAKIASEAAPKTEPEESEPESIIRRVLVASYDPRNPVFYVPYRPKGDQVVGREQTILSLRDQLTQGCRTAIGQTAAFEGLGGLGKTQLAVEYAYLYRDEYPNGVIWLNADQDIDAQLTDLADKARWISPESEHKYKLEIAQQRLRTYSDCLIVFDNVESIDAIERYLPEPQANPHLLLTSRTEQLGFTPVPLNVLDGELSLKLLLLEAGRRRQPEEQDELDAAREVANTLDGLPLALELAGAYVSYRQLRWEEYRDLLRQNLKAALPGKFLGGSFTRHEKDIYSTLKINEEVFTEEPRLRDILDLLTWAGSSPMGLSLICALLNVQNAAELTSALGLGTVLRVLQKSPDADSYAAHRLVREVRREDMPLERHGPWVRDVCQRVGVWFQERRENFADLTGVEAEIDHLQAWQQHAAHHAPEHCSRLTWLQSYPFYYRGNYREAKKWVERALHSFEQALEGDLQLKAHLLNDLGTNYLDLGDSRRALEYHEEALSMRLGLFGERHRESARSLNNVGVDYQELGDYHRALEYTKRALATQLQLFGEQDRDTAASFNNIGTSYARLGDYESALEYTGKALRIQIALFGENYPDTATTFHNIGTTFGQLKDHTQALENKQKALSIRLGLFGERHPDIAGAFNNVGFTYRELGDYPRALEYSRKALGIQLDLFGEWHPDTARSFEYLGAIYADQGDYRAALLYREKALAIHLHLFGERHPSTARSLNNLGCTFGVVGDHDRALDCHEKALRITRELFGDEHSDTVSSVNNVAQDLSMLERRSEALKLVDDFVRRLPTDHPHYELLKRRRRQILAKPLREGFRQPPSNPAKRRKGKRKKRR